MFPPTLHFFPALAALQQNRAQSRLLYLLIVYYLTSPQITFLPGEFLDGKVPPGPWNPHFSAYTKPQFS